MLSSIWTLALLLGGALLAAALERAMLRRVPERGPATRVRLAVDRAPVAPDPWFYAAAPVLALLAIAWGAVVIPLDRGLVGADLGIGLFYFIVVADIVVPALASGGWGANTPDAVEACYRATAQLAAYVVPLGLAILGPIMMARSLSTVAIVEAQDGAGLWYIAPQPIAFLLYIATAAMQTYRPPFAEPFSNQIQAGVIGAYGGWKAALWRVALSGLLFLAGAMGAVLFLGGYAGPVLPGPIWMLLKSIAVMALIVGLGLFTRPRSVAEMLALSWKVLIPIGLLNVLVVGFLILLGVGQSPFR